MTVYLIVGNDGSWNNGCRLSGIDVVRIPNEMGLHSHGRRSICRRYHPYDLWHSCDYHSWQDYSDGVRFGGRFSVQHLFGL